MAWTYLQSDVELFDRELASFVPPAVFDAHAHLYEVAHFRGDVLELLRGGPAIAGWETYCEYIRQITPGRRTSGLFFGFPHPQVEFDAANALVAREVKRDARSRGQMLIYPSMDPELIRQTVRREGFVGLKCYHVYSDQKPTTEASIPSYLPESQVRVAHEEGLSITVHMVRSRAMADPDNQEVIRRYARAYPNARFILAHAARGFNPHHTIEGIGALRGLGNVWCDTSAVTEAGAMEEIIRVLGAGRLLYGSDFPVSHIHGRCVAVGDSFIWLSEQDLALDQPYGRIVPALVGLESLRVLKLACRSMNLSDTEVEGIFRTNAESLFGLGSGG